MIPDLDRIVEEAMRNSQNFRGYSAGKKIGKIEEVQVIIQLRFKKKCESLISVLQKFNEWGSVDDVAYYATRARSLEDVEQYAKNLLQEQIEAES